MFIWEQPGERSVVLLTAGNLGVTQGVITRIEAAVDAARAARRWNPSLPVQRCIAPPNWWAKR